LLERRIVFLRKEIIAGKQEYNGKKDLPLYCGERFRYENCALPRVATGIPNEDVGNEEL
jgi:hypothetical protein